MSTVVGVRRHALGMPAGSVRAMLGLSVMVLLWIVALKDPTHLPPTFIYLLFLKVLILVHYFATHSRTQGKSVGSRSALGLPRGTIRIGLLAGFAGLVAFLYQGEAQFATELSGMKIMQMLGLMMGGFFVGYLISGIFRTSTGDLPAWLEDVQAWAALLATVGLVILVMIYSVINPSLEDRPINADLIESGLSALIGFYFGART